jgi:hypothetical protein
MAWWPATWSSRRSSAVGPLLFVGGLGGLARGLGVDLGRDGPAVDPGLDARGQLDGDDLAVEAADGAEESCRGDDLVAKGERGLQRLQGLEAALLGADEQEIEHAD